MNGMKIERDRKTWRFLAAFGLCLVCLGCATGPRVKVTAEVVDPEQAKSRSVAVVADSFMDDTVEADNVAGLLRQQLVLRGFKVSQNENEAELIVIPTIERSTIERSSSTGAGTVPATMRRPFDVSHGLGQSSLMESQNAMRNLGFEFGTLPSQEQPRIGLMVTAVSREVWSNALLEPQTEIPRVWRIVAITAARKQDVTSNLVEAVGAKLGEIAASAAPAVQSTPTPAPAARPTPRSTPAARPTPRSTPAARPTATPSETPKKKPEGSR
jgi:hypothetical protein